MKKPSTCIKYAIRIGDKNSNELGINSYSELATMKAAAGAEIVCVSTELVGDYMQ